MIDAHYRPGQGMLIRFTALFPIGDIANTKQLAGWGNPGNGFFFGYNGTNEGFGILHRRNGLVQIVRLTLNSSASSSGNVTVTLNGVAYTFALTASADTHFTAFQIANRSYTGWYVQNIGNVVEFTNMVAGAMPGVYSYNGGTTGSSGAFTTVKAGVAPTDIFIPQSAWNIDPFNGTGSSKVTLNPVNGNVYQISFQWLGYGDIIFYIEDPTSGQIVPCHHILYSNANTTPSLQIPHGPLRYQVENFGVPTNPGIVAGTVILNGPLFSVSNSKIVFTTELVLLALRNNPQYNGYNNQTNIKLTSLTVSSQGNNPVIIKFYLNPTLGSNTSVDYPDWTYVNQIPSVMLQTITPSTITGGTVIYQVTSPNAGGISLPSNILDFIISRRQTIAISGVSIAGNNTVVVSVTWLEDK